jgi:hypothetical protein
MGLDRRDPDLGGNRSVIRLRPELADSLPAISSAPLTGEDPGWGRTEMNPPDAKGFTETDGQSIS